MPHFFWIDACSIATIWPFICASSAAVCLSPPTKKAVVNIHPWGGPLRKAADGRKKT
jgi:hypothetical protein